MSCNSSTNNTNTASYYFVQTLSVSHYTESHYAESHYAELSDDEAKPLPPAPVEFLLPPPAMPSAPPPVRPSEPAPVVYNGYFGPLLGGSEKLIELARNLFAEKKMTVNQLNEKFKSIL